MVLRAGGSPDPGVVVITGGSSGVGRATALAFARQGARLVLSARDAGSLAEAAADCRALGARALTVPADVAEAAAVDAVAAAAVAEYGRIDVWVHSAAVVAYGRFADVPPEVFRRVVDVGVHGAVHVARTALAQFRRQGSGTLILVGSLLGEIAAPYMSSYVTAKWALRGLARVLAIETRDAPGVSVCLVSPGSVDTPIYRLAANYAGRAGRPPPPVDRPEKVARVILRRARRPRPRTGVGPANRLARFGFTATPALYDALVTPLMERAGLSAQPIAAVEGNVLRAIPDGERVHGQWGRHWLRPLAAAGIVAGTAAGIAARGGAGPAARTGAARGRRTHWR